MDGASRAGQRLKADLCCIFYRAAEQAAEKRLHFFCHSERSEESLILFVSVKRREIPRSARKGKRNYFFRSL
jgi:hypothetical protein